MRELLKHVCAAFWLLPRAQCGQEPIENPLSGKLPTTS